MLIAESKNRFLNRDTLLSYYRKTFPDTINTQFAIDLIDLEKLGYVEQSQNYTGEEFVEITKKGFDYLRPLISDFGKNRKDQEGQE
jgi:hypothetical protein